MKVFVTALGALLALAAPVWAQVFPSPNGTAVLDDAELIAPEAEAALVARLAQITADSGAQVQVVTLPSTSLYTAGEDLPVYAGLLFDELGLAQVPDGKAILLLVFAEDRELRIEPGAAYAGADDTAAAAAIIATTIAPAFQAGNFGEGIAAGVEAIAAQMIADPAPEPAPEPAPVADQPAAEGGGNALYWVLGVIAAAIAGIVAMVRRSAARLAATPCPACGKTGLRQESVTLREATEKAEGAGERRTICPHCGHTTAVPYTIPRKERTVADKAAPAAAQKGGKDKAPGGGASGSW
jgi:uncharacterized protein